MNTTLTRTMTLTGTILAIFAFSAFAGSGMASDGDSEVVDPRCRVAVDYPVLIGSGYECADAFQAGRETAPTSTESPDVVASTSANSTIRWTVLDGSGYEGQTTPAPVVLHGERAR